MPRIRTSRVPRRGTYRISPKAKYLERTQGVRISLHRAKSAMPIMRPQAQIMPRSGNSRGRSPQFMRHRRKSFAIPNIYTPAILETSRRGRSVSRGERVRPARLLTIRTARPAFSSEANTFICLPKEGKAPRSAAPDKKAVTAFASEQR
jgi:hypothetical protein